MRSPTKYVLDLKNALILLPRQFKSGLDKIPRERKFIQIYAGVSVFLVFYTFNFWLNEYKIGSIPIFSSELIDINLYKDNLVYKFKCDCRSNDRIYVSKVRKDEDKEKTVIEKLFSHYSYEYHVHLNNQFQYKIDQDVFENTRTMCHHEKVLRRGPNQKVIGVSLYGRHFLYYIFLDEMIKSVSKLYPDWVVRVHHDNSIDPGFICEMECLENKNGTLMDNVDFCNIEEINFGIFDKKTWNARYLHGMKWRWFPIADDFVDYFTSRDTDTVPLQREVDAVNEWLGDNTLLHVMRDHPYHSAPILGGMWGFANKLNRLVANEIFEKIFNSEDKKGISQSMKGQDQQFLAIDVWPMIDMMKNFTVHDGYHCMGFNRETWKPFPTQRIGDCFVGCVGFLERDCCSPNRTFKPCPCKPPKHPDWEFC